MIKVLVLGASGMAGHVVALYLRENGYKVDTLAAHQSLDGDTFLVDVMDLEALASVLSSGNYDKVVNCIGILVKESEQRRDLATFINSFLPHFLENYYSGTETQVVHIGTDTVFSGGHPPYIEQSPQIPEDFYSRSKSLGELDNDKDLTFRLSIIGPELKENGPGLFSWFYGQSGVVKGFSKVNWTGITTIELAKAVKAAIEQGLTGIYHLVPDGHITKLDLLKLIKETFNLTGIELRANNDIVSDRRLKNTRDDFSFGVSSYESMIEEMKGWMDSHAALYQHYR